MLFTPFFRITLDYRSKEPDTPVTPEVGKEFPCAPPPTTKFLDNLDVNSEAFVTFYIRSSTTGRVSIVMEFISIIFSIFLLESASKPLLARYVLATIKHFQMR